MYYNIWLQYMFVHYMLYVYFPTKKNYWMVTMCMYNMFCIQWLVVYICNSLRSALHHDEFLWMQLLVAFVCSSPVDMLIFTCVYIQLPLINSHSLFLEDQLENYSIDWLELMAIISLKKIYLIIWFKRNINFSFWLLFK